MTRTRAVIALSVLSAAAAALIVTLAVTGDGNSRRASGPFSWLRASPPPPSWDVARTPGGAVLAYPPGWRAIKTDPGTASVALRGRGRRINGYLNVTPRQGAETLEDWREFRPRKNRDEGERRVRLLASISDAELGPGRASCVIDVYTTSVTTYQEIACLVSGRRSSAVVVAAAPIGQWRERSAALERAVSSFAV